VFILRAQIGEPIPSSWGNAATWAIRAAADGYLVNNTPSYGAIMQISNVDGGLGHVAFVESVSPDGSWTISEMNVKGLDVVDQKTLSAAAAASYSFIHTQLSH
jgi:surface antigen